MRIIGWATITSPSSGGEAQELLDATGRDIEAYLDAQDWRPWIELHRVDQAIVVQALYATNHYNAGTDAMIDSFRFIAQVAPSAYGQLYIRDDEDQFGNHARNTEFVVVLARGAITLATDPFFTPCIPNVEGFDPDSEEEKHVSDFVDKYLPIGSVVRLDGGTKKFMIFGRHQQDTANDQVFDYVGCPYPEGNVGPKATFLFNHKDIAWVHYFGLRDGEEQAWCSQLLSITK